MTLRDLDRILTIENASFPQPWSRQSFVSELERNRLAIYLVARQEDEIIGYGGIWVVLDESHLTTLAVDSRFRGRGAGRALLSTLMRRAREEGARRMTLEVRPSNLPARRLYESFGFIVLGVRKNYYYDEDALLMVNENL